MQVSTTHSLWYQEEGLVGEAFLLSKLGKPVVGGKGSLMVPSPKTEKKKKVWKSPNCFCSIYPPTLLLLAGAHRYWFL